MNNNGGRARRRPDDVSRGGVTPSVGTASGQMRQTYGRSPSSKGSGRPRTTESSNNQPSRPQSRRNGSRTDVGTSARGSSGQMRRFRYTPAPRSQALVDIKREERRLREAEKERKWQEDIVRVKGGVDKIMLAIILVLVCLGSIMVFSASYPVAVAEGKDSLYYVGRQIRFVAIGSAFMLAASLFPYKWYKKWGPFVAYGVSVLLLIAVLFIGKSEGEAKRWIGFGGFTIQPSELMKVSIVLILAWYVEKFKPQIDARLDRWHTIKYNVVGPGIFVGIACVLILLEKHLSGTIITGLVALAVMFVGGCHFGWTALIFGICGAAAGGLFLIANPYALKRITTFTDDNADKLDELYQTTQGIYAIGSGGLWGLGFGQSRQKYSYVSAAHTDFIFSIWCEEMGFIGGIFLVALFIAFVWRGYVIASRAPDTFSMLTAFGITTHVGLQAFLNMCVASDIIPNTGISLPFFSYGGSSLIVLLAEMGLLLSISRQYYRKKGDLDREKLMKDV
ncbi:MAG: putative lipid II flippase FtsW [Ruminococcaceae bacterium]|nr:putative lipid II flippase FtsW [Oscillospiraceae bacterium]